MTDTTIRHSFVQANGIRMHIAEAGEGFPVVLCHGWPELWYSWRHQLPALAAAGFRAIAPDMRGYGETDAPPDPQSYRTSVICADIAGLLDALGLDQAVIVGHDWGGWHIWQFALRYPERTARLIGLNTPYSPPPPVPYTELMKAAFGPGGYYILYNQEPGVAEAEFEADIRGNLAKVFHPWQRGQDLWTMATLVGGGLFTGIAPGTTFLSPEELDVYARAFEKTGTRGSFNWYRAIDYNWEDARTIADPVIRTRTLMITAEHDTVLRPEQAEPMREWLPDLRIELIRQCSHWTQQERPEEVNRLVIDFLADLRQ